MGSMTRTAGQLVSQASVISAVLLVVIEVVLLTVLLVVL
jgi:hypothetical protein